MSVGQHLLAVYVLLLEPVLGVRFYRTPAGRPAARTDGSTTARPALYGTLIIWEWAWVAVIAILFAGEPEWRQLLGLTGLGPPASGELSPTVAGILVGAAAGALAAAFIARRNAGFARLRRESVRQAELLLPRSSMERWLYAGVSITAGICEEVLFRGFLMYYLGTQFPFLGTVGTVVTQGAIFGVAHSYQGWRGVMTTSLTGCFLGVLYVLSGSIIPGMILHALLDLNALTINTADSSDPAGEVVSDR